MIRLDHRLLLALERAPADPTPAAVHRGGVLVAWGAWAPSLLAARWSSGEASAGVLYPRLRAGEEGGPRAPAGRRAASTAPALDRAGEGLPGDGAGVVIGVVDHGLELRHAALAGAVEAAWDQRALAGGRPERLGRWWDQRALAEVLAGRQPGPAPGPSSHGLASASLAAGRPSARSRGGAAPAARLIAVSPHTWREAGGWELHPGGVEAAVDFIEARAAGRPAVLLLGMERHVGPGDGGGHLARRLARFIRGGGYVVSAAGNGGDRPARWRLPADRESVIHWVPDGEGTLELWHRGAVEVSLDGRPVGPPEPPLPGAARRRGDAWLSHLGDPPGWPGWGVVSVTAARAISLVAAPAPGAVLILRVPAPLGGRLTLRGARPLGAAGLPALAPGVISAGAPGGARGRRADGAPIPTVSGPALALAATDLVPDGLSELAGTSAAAAWAAGRLAALISRGEPDPVAALAAEGAARFG